MKISSFCFAIMLISFMSASAYAGECELSITREACAGKDKESYAKCNGQTSCKEQKKTGSAASCGKEAAKACQNSRLDITKSKVISATFDGKPVEDGKDFCKTKTDGIFDPAVEFNKCQ